MKNWKITFYLFAVSPVLYVVSLFTFNFHSAIQLGFFPSYSQPDPKEIEVYEIYQPIILTFGNIWLVSLLIWIPLVLIYWLIYLKKNNMETYINKCYLFPHCIFINVYGSNRMVC